MRTTVRLNDALLAQVKQEAARRGETLTALIEQGLRLVLTRAHEPKHRRRVTLPTCRATGGVLPGIDLDDTSAVLDAMERHR